MENENILVLLVNYFNEEETSTFIKNELLKQGFRNVQIAVVNNGAIDSRILKQSADTFSNVHLYEAPENLGYAGGAHFGLKKYLENAEIVPDFVIISNSDIHFIEKNFFEQLAAKHKNTDAGIIGPSIFSSRTKSEQNPLYHQRISRFKLRFLRLIFSSYAFYFLYESFSLLLRKLYPFFKGRKMHNPGMTDVYAIHGSFLIFTKFFFSKGGHLKYGSFLYGEEIFFAEQCRSLELRVMYDSGLKITHNEHATTALIKSKTSVKYMYDSTGYLLKIFSDN